MRHVITYPGENGFWVVECPSLPGCVSQGKTRDEALVNIKEAIQAYIESLKAHHQPIPVDRVETHTVSA